jgi:hypothetical protein
MEWVKRILEIVSEELDYLDEERIREETQHILDIGEEIAFIEKIKNKEESYKIISKAKKTAMKEEDLKKKS